MEDYTSDRKALFSMADIAEAERRNLNGETTETGDTWTADMISKEREEQKLTWHECDDRRTLQLIPSIINGSIAHSGGNSINRNLDALGDYLDDHYGSIAIDKTQLGKGQQI